MRSAQRNMTPFWYRLYTSNAPITTKDEWGNNVETGEYNIGYSDPVSMCANISPASGASITEQFGNLDNYDKVIVTTDMDCPIDEDSILYVGITPVKDMNTKLWSPHNYVVRRVAKSINGISIAVRKVDVS